MYASQRSVNKNSEVAQAKKMAGARNRMIHKGMMKTHIQVTPDGKVIQHYKMNSRDAAMYKTIKQKVEELQEKEAENEVVDAVNGDK